MKNPIRKINFPDVSLSRDINWEKLKSFSIFRLIMDQAKSKSIL
jgi:hypothetical protein